MQLIFCLMAAFVFAKIEFKGKNLLFLLFLITLMIPEQVIMAPLFIVFLKLGLTDTYLGLILPGLFSAFGTFLLRQHIMTIPNAMIKAAVIDGASYYKIFSKIIFPLSKTTPAAEPIILKFMQYTASGSQEETLNDMIAEFERQNKDIKIQVEVLSYAEYFTKLSTVLSSESSTPDIFELGYENVITYASKGALKDLNDSIAKDKDFNSGTF